MNKKGQFYIIATFVLVVLAFGVLSYSSQIKQPVAGQDKFEQLYTNYEEESIEVINNAQLEQKEFDDTKHMQKKLKDFTMNFIKYAKTEQSGFSIVYAIS